MMGIDEPLNVWQWLDERRWNYLPFYQSYQSPCGRFYITQDTLYKMPGEVIYFLKTGFVRNFKIFDNGLFHVNPENMGYKMHKDGRCVELRRVK